MTSNGLVTGISEGTATITAETENGGYQAFCTVRVNPDYPLWDPSKDYPLGSYVLYDGRVFQNWYYANTGIRPTEIDPYGNGAYNPWKEITNEWRPYNRYWGGEIVWHNGKQYKAKNDCYNEEPGVSASWQEITNEWRPNNTYVYGDIVWHNGKQYRAKYWNQNEEPGNSPAWELIE
ncbi:MAG TPA: hypothetical protein GXX46_08960 [Peptococcaceae bacterium]|nr:hypothetical protein [Peptococcaceae bacterium]